MTNLLIKYLYSLKKTDDFIFLGSIAPYYESYKNGPITDDVRQYYLDLVSIMDKYVDKQYWFVELEWIKHMVRLLN